MTIPDDSLYDVRGGSSLFSVPGSHAVQFYEGEEYLQEVVADYVAGGLAAGEGVIVIARDEHRQAFARALEESGIILPSRAIAFHDAEDVLSRFMAGELPDTTKFMAEIVSILETIPSGRPIRIYGEMVDVLWRSGKRQAAIRLEELWNELAESRSFTLLCAYAIGNFYSEAHRGAFDRICRAHSRVIPNESVEVDGGHALAAEVARLQQRAGSLEAEILQRKELEAELREALNARRRAEKALQEAHAELKDFIDSASINIHSVGPDGIILWANDAELRLLGYEREEYVGRPIRDFHADAGVVDEILRRLSAGEEIHGQPARLIAKDGATRDVLISSNARFERGHLAYTRCFTHDVTAQRNAERSAAALAERWQFLSELSDVLTSSLDYEVTLDAVARSVIPRIADWCAIDIRQEDGTCRRVAVHAADPSRIPLAQELHRRYPLDGSRPSPILEAMEAQKPLLVPEMTDERIAAYARDDEHHRLARQLGIVSLMVVPLVSRNTVLGAMTFASAESGRRYGEHDLALAGEIARRAAISIENARLYTEAQNANRAKDEFLATLSHELRTPMTAILGWSRFLRIGDPNAETLRSAIESIDRAAGVQAQLIDDVLDMSRIISGKLRLDIRPADLTAIVDAAIETVKPALIAKQIRFSCTRDPHAGMVWADPHRLQQAVWNLLTNAAKFTDAGGSVSVEVRRSRGTARIVVRDTGQGIDREFLPHVFERFRQAESTSTRSHGGLGLGLAVVRYVVEMHGGRVTAESEGLGKGATFTIDLPAISGIAAGISETEARQPSCDLQGVRVLFVDDQIEVRSFVHAVLERYGADVKDSGSPAEAMSTIESWTPDVVITDIAMPGEDGYNLARSLSSLDWGPSPAPPIVALTAYGKQVEKSEGNGFAAYLTKPIDPVDLVEAIRGVL